MILISPTRPLVNDPCFNVPLPIQKTVGLKGKRTCKVDIMICKNFFIAGEIAYIMVNVDNT